MTLTSRLFARIAGLPPARTYDVTVEHDLGAPMPDGVTLLADRYAPRGDASAPIVLVRTPYGRRSYGVFGRLFAERGYQAVIQSVRGTFGSGGAFEFRDEREDGRATLEWLARQRWFSGRVGMFGASYLGFVQWAVAADAPAYLRALAIQIATSSRRDSLFAGEALHLDFALTLVRTLARPIRSFADALRARFAERRELLPAYAHLPLAEADRLVAGRTIAFYQDWLAHDAPGDPYWQAMDHSPATPAEAAAIAPAVHLVAGWFDVYLARQVADYAALRSAGRNPHLTIGPWAHTDMGVLATGLRESLAWFDATLRDDVSHLRARPVRVFVMGARQWRELPEWPPPSTPTRFHLQPEGALGSDPPACSPPDSYVYDPADPTPAAGGAVFGFGAGARDNRRLESRADVLTYTSAPLPAALETIGSARAELHVRSSLGHADFFVRLCDVAPGGRSTNVCDGFLRLWPGRVAPQADGTLRLEIELAPTACRFARGHRLRVQVSSGAHPRFARNLGTGEPLATAMRREAARQQVFHDPAHPSAIVLPVCAAGAV